MRTNTHDAALPTGWSSSELDVIADVQLGKMLDRKRTEGTLLRYVRNINVRWGSIEMTDLFEMPFRDRELNRYSLVPGDVLVCEGGEPGRAAVWKVNDPTIKYQKALHRVRMCGGILPPWLVLQLYFDAQRGALAQHFTGTTIKHLPREAFREYSVRLAPVREQHRIVDVIESYFTRLDDVVATLERVQRNLKRYRASVLNAAIEGGLVPTEAELARAEGRDYEPASVLLDRVLAKRRRRWEEAELVKMKAKGNAPKDDKWKAKYKEPISPDSGRLPDLPEGWCWSTVGQLGKAVTGTTPPMKDGRNYGDEIPFFKPTDLDAGYYVTDARQSLSRLGAEHARLLPAGSVLVTCIGATIGKTGLARVPCATNQQINALVPESPLRAGRFLFWYFCSGAGQSQVISNASSTTLPILNKGRFELLPVPLPPVAEQDRIVAEIERLLSVESALSDSTRAGRKRLNRLRQSILKWAFEGRLVDQDPTDEPVAALLERIRAERTGDEARRTNRGRRLAGKRKACSK